MEEKKHVEELVDFLQKMKKDADFMYQYGHLTVSSDFFKELSPGDKKRLIYLALSTGNRDVKNVAMRLMPMYDDSLEKVRMLLSELPEEDRDELIEITKTMQVDELTKDDRNAIAGELELACGRIGNLDVEEAYWILMHEGEESEWVSAMDDGEDIPYAIRTPNQVIYSPKDEDVYDLTAAMRRAKWVLHVHNHPDRPGYIVLCAPSCNDLSFAAQWKSKRPALENKMKFFVIKGREAVEYSLPEDETIEWDI
jgi:hypothetical protein